MWQKFVFACVIIAVIHVSTTDAKGGRGGGGRSSGRSDSISSRGSRSSSSKSSNIGGTHNSINSKGLFHGLFSAPYHYSYRPMLVRHSSTSSHHISSKKEEEADASKENENYAIGYSISRALSSDFFSIFNVVHDISMYPDYMRNEPLVTTTTESPVSTYNLNDIVIPIYTPYDSNKFEAELYSPHGYNDRKDPTFIDKNESIQELLSEINDSINKVKEMAKVPSPESDANKNFQKSMEAKDGLGEMKLPDIYYQTNNKNIFKK